MTAKERMEKDNCTKKEAVRRNRKDKRLAELQAEKESDAKRGFSLTSGRGSGFNLT